MESIVNKRVRIKLTNIEYKEMESSDRGEITAADRFTIVKVEKETAELLVERKIESTEKPAFNLTVAAKVFYTAAEGIDLTEKFNKEYLKKHVNELTGLAMSYISALITQITGSFGNYPLITPVIIMNDAE